MVLMIKSTALPGLYEELLGRGLTRVSKKIALKALNKPGSANVPSWIVSSTPVLVDKDDIFTYHISEDTFTKLIDFRDSADGKYLKARLASATALNMASTAVRAMLLRLYQAQLCTEAEYVGLLRLGEVQLSRAEEVFNRKLTLEDFE